MPTAGWARSAVDHAEVSTHGKDEAPLGCPAFPACALSPWSWSNRILVDPWYWIVVTPAAVFAYHFIPQSLQVDPDKTLGASY